MEADPIRIDTIPLSEGGAIGLTFCPGKIDPSGQAGPHHRDLEEDIQALLHWGATHLVTLLETHEFELLGVEGLGEATEASGLEWSWLPIPDGDVPGETFHLCWHYTGLRLRNLLRNGRKVVLHCRGGLGRAGLVASQLLIELGWNPEPALQKVRTTRRGAVETSAQEGYIHRLSPGPLADAKASRMLAVLLGGAVGDAFGYPVEFLGRERIHVATWMIIYHRGVMLSSRLGSHCRNWVTP